MTHARECAHSATSHTAEYAQRWCMARQSTELSAAQMLLAAGRSAARMPTCEHTLCSVRTTSTPPNGPGGRAVLLRALSLLGPGELCALRVVDPMLLELVGLALDNNCTIAISGTDDTTVPRAVVKLHWLDESPRSLCSVAWTGYGNNLDAAVSLVARYAATLTELDCDYRHRHEKADAALARCTRLESLTHARCYAPATWLGLSQLHTLRGVDLSVVSTDAIAAALLRLRTLHAFLFATPPPYAAVAGFVETLLPRLEALGFEGSWPRDESRDESSKPPPFLPRLRELDWLSFDFNSKALPTARMFMGAQPFVVAAPVEFFVDWMSAADAAAADFDKDAGKRDAYRLFARVHQVLIGRVGDAPAAADVARLLQAAPQLRKLTTRMDRDLSWLSDPSFSGLIHPRLRALGVWMGNVPPPEWALQLRQLHFPRLRQVRVNSDQLALA